MDLSVRDVGEVSKGGGRESRGRISPFFLLLRKTAAQPDEIRVTRPDQQVWTYGSILNWTILD